MKPSKAFGTAICRAGLLSAVLLGGCIDPGQSPVQLGVVAESTATDTFEGRDGWQVTLTEASLRVGPLYLCAGAQAGDLCETARAEMRSAWTIDALDSGVQSLGTVEGLSGEVRSAMWDYGRPWPLAAEAPVTIDGVGQSTAEAPSVRLVGEASREGETVPFDVAIDLAPTRAGVVVVRASNVFDAEAVALVDGGTLVLAVDPAEWLSGVRFEDVPSEGWEEDSQAMRSVRNALTTRARPALSFR